MSKTEWAAWAQVIGASAAIGAGSFGIAWQVKNQWQLYRRQLLDGELRAVGDLCDLFESGRVLLAELQHATATQESYYNHLLDATDGSRWHQTLELFREYDVNSIPGTALKVAFRIGRAQLEGAHDFRSEAYQAAAAGRLATKQADVHRTRAKRAAEMYATQLAVLSHRLWTLEKQ